MPEDRVCLRNVGVALELQSGTTFIGILTQWLTRERYDEREDVVSERIDTGALLEALQEAFLDDTRTRAPSHARSATVGLDSLRLEVEIGRYSGNQRWLDASTAPLLRRALNSACEEGLEKDPHYGDHILLCRYVTQPTDTTPSIRSDTEPGEGAPFSPARSAAHDKRTEERERDNDVISISSNAHTEPDDGALSDPGGPTTVYDEHEANDGPDALGTITLGGTEEEWTEACRFFRHDPACREMDSGKKLFGTKMALRPGQLRDVWHFLDATYGTGRTGYISALDTGLGKTMVALGTVAVLRTVDLMRLVCRGDPDTCEVAEGFGYNDCICRSGSLMSKIHQELIPGITVFLTPNSTVQGAQNSADVFLERVVTLPDETKWEFVEVIRSEANKETKEKLFAHDVVDGGNKIKRAKKSSGAGKGMPAKKMSGFDSINTGQLNKNQSAEGLQDSAVSYLDDRQEYPFKERHFLLILPSDASSLDPRHAIMRSLTKTYPLAAQGWQRKVDVRIVAPFWVRHCILDEFHRIKGGDTIVYTCMKMFRRRHPTGKMVSMFMSATPFTKELKASLKVPLDFILPESWSSAGDQKRAGLSRARFDTLVFDLQRSQRGADDTSEVVFGELKDFLAGFMTRRTVQSRFLGGLECALPLHKSRVIDCEKPQGSSKQDAWSSIVRSAKQGGKGGKSCLVPYLVAMVRR